MKDFVLFIALSAVAGIFAISYIFEFKGGKK